MGHSVAQRLSLFIYLLTYGVADQTQGLRHTQQPLCHGIKSSAMSPKRLGQVK